MRIIKRIYLGVSILNHILFSVLSLTVRICVGLTSNCSSVHLSKLTDLTFEMCVPNFLCKPPQRMQRKTPKFHEAHRVPSNRNRYSMIDNLHHIVPFWPQSAQYLFGSSFSNSMRVCSFLRAVESFTVLMAD